MSNTTLKNHLINVVIYELNEMNLLNTITNDAVH